jgi:hypothetical protein
VDERADRQLRDGVRRLLSGLRLVEGDQLAQLVGRVFLFENRQIHLGVIFRVIDAGEEAVQHRAHLQPLLRHLLVESGLFLSRHF